MAYPKTLKDAALPGVVFAADSWSLSPDAAKPFAVVPGKAYYFPLTSAIRITGVDAGQFESADLVLSIAQLSGNKGPWPIALAENETIDGDFAGNALVVEKGTSLVSGDLKTIEKKIDLIATLLDRVLTKLGA